MSRATADQAINCWRDRPVMGEDSYFRSCPLPLESPLQQGYTTASPQQLVAAFYIRWATISMPQESATKNDFRAGWVFPASTSGLRQPLQREIPIPPRRLPLLHHQVNQPPRNNNLLDYLLIHGIFRDLT